MDKNNDTHVSQHNPLRSFLFGAIVFIIIILIRFILSFPSQIFDILLNFYCLAISILFIILYQRKMKYAWHSILFIYIPLFPLYLYRTIIVRDLLSYIVSLVWIGVIFLLISWRKRYFEYLEQEPPLLNSQEQTK